MKFGQAVVAAAVLASYAPVARTQPAGPAGTRLEMTIGGRTISRADAAGPAWAYQWPGIYFEGRFKGDEVDLAFDDPASRFNVVIDGHIKQVVSKPGRKTVRFAALGPQAHTVRLEKRSETQTSVGAFEGFFVGSKADALPPRPVKRRMEFIGDSWTLGYGNTSASPICSAEQLQDATDTQEAFGPLVARRLGADYQVNAYSGIGLVRNYAGGVFTVGHLPDLWPRVLFSAAQHAPPWRPQVIVVTIGVNDFSAFGGNDAWPTQAAMAADYEKAYVAFVKALRRWSPGALIVLGSSAQYPPGFAQAVDRVFGALKAQGAANLDRLVFPPLAATGCDHHPDARDHVLIADALEAVIARHPEVWKSAALSPSGRP